MITSQGDTLILWDPGLTGALDAVPMLQAGHLKSPRKVELQINLDAPNRLFMLPSFDNLTESQLMANVSLFRAAGFSEPEAGVRAMMRIVSQWHELNDLKLLEDDGPVLVT